MKFCLIIGLVVVLSGPALQAQMQVVLYQDLNNYSYDDVGEFDAIPNAALLAVNPTLTGYVPGKTADLTVGSVNFQTLCIEPLEYINPGTTYSVSISDEIKFNGGQFPSGEPLTLGTAWLYSQFAAGTLSGYTYTEGSGRIKSAGDLQQAIWYLQGEAGLTNGNANGAAFVGVAEAALDGNINAAAAGAYGVVALNLTDGNDQDQLMVVPEPSFVDFGFLLLIYPGVNRLARLLRTEKN